MPLLVDQQRTAALQALYVADPAVFVWWGTEIECVSAVSRLERSGDLTAAAATTAFARLDALAGFWNEIDPLRSIRGTARRILRVHDLRATDALQLSAALIASENQPAFLEFVSLDRRLAAAADREGLRVVDVPAS
ncbi:MAG: type II toxin-antitoxin system VapC family toxin [Actinomycetota bacterium]